MNKRPANQRLMQAVRTICARRSGFSVPAVALLSFGMVSVALAGPTGGIVVDGQATISTPAAGTTVIDQTSQHVQVNWNTFDVGASESVRFQQPNSSSVALNRILDQNPSQIFGRIDANGQVILVNPNGMLFGASAQLNVGSLVASSLDVIGFDAATGRYTFGASGTDVGAIVNDGSIAAARGGSVTLLGGRVTNNGSIIADFGTVNLAAGRAATLDLAGDGLLRLEVDGELLSNNAGASAAVENGGVIEANGGQVLLTAKAVDDVFANLVNNTGVVRANRIDNSGGTIRLIGAGGTVRSSGVLDASAGDAVSSGGTVEMLGEQVGLFGAALVDVSGATSGGTALIGGDYQGKNPDVLNAARTYVSADSSIRADAGTVGDGGRVIVWADEITRFNGSISARGGALSGDGGFAEVSGKETLLFRGSANLSAMNGFAGELLLDPRNIIVATGGEGDLAGGTGDDTVANTYAFAEDAGDDITVAPSTITDILDTGTTVTLQAHNDITVTDAIDGSASTTPGGGLIFQAGDDIFINADVRTNDGAIQFTAGDPDATPTGDNGDDVPTGELTLASGATLAAGIADVTLNSDGGMQLLGTVLGDAITLNSGGNMQLPGIVSGSAITAISGGTLTVGTLDAGATGSVNLTATGQILDDTDQSTRITGGTLTVNATAIGASSTDDEIDTAVSSLYATASNGGIYIRELDGLTLTDVSAAGSGSDVVVTSTTGDIVADSVTASRSVAVTATAGDIEVGSVNGTTSVALTATAGAIIDDGNNATRIAAGSLALSAGSDVGATGTTGQIDTNVVSLMASSSGGSVYIGELNGFALTNVSAGGASGDVNVTSTTGNIVADNVTASRNVALTATAGNIVVGSVGAATAVTLTATAGSITDDGLNASRIATGALTLNAGTAIGATGGTGQIDTNVTSLTATAGNGGIYIDEFNGLTLTNVSASGASGDVNVTSTTGDIVADSVTASRNVALTASAGDIEVGTVSGTTSVALTATAGSITDDGDNTTRIAAGTLALNAGTAIGATGGTGQIDTNVASLTASAGNGSVYIGESNGLTLTNVSAAGTGNDVNVTSTTNDIIATNVTAAGDVTLTATAGNVAVGTISAGDAVTLAAAGAIADDNNNATRISGGALTLTAGTTIGTSGGNGQIDTNVTSMTASAGNGGVYIGELNGLTLTSVSAAGTGGDVNVTSATGDIVATNVTAAHDVTLTGTSGNTTVASISAGNAVTLTAGAITDDGNDATGINADALTLIAGTAIGASGAAGQIDTNVGSLTAVAGAGGVYIGEANGLTLTSVSAAVGDVDVRSTTGDIVANTVAATGSVTLTATAGDIEASAINAGGAVTLTATAGAITDDDDDATVIAGSSVSLSAATNLGTVVDFAAADDADVGSSLDVQTNGALSASVTSNSGQINLNLSGTPTLAAGAITLGSGSNRAGAIVLQSAGNLNVAGLTPGAINIGSGNTTRLGLRSGGVLTLPSSGGFTDQPADYLLVRGATDVVDNDGTPREFSLAATTLDFRSGAAGGATILNTNVGQLSASVGNNQNLTVHETNALTLGTLDAGNGSILLTAGGAVTDDGDDLTRIVGNTATLSASSLGTASSALDTQVNALNASATSGGIYISEVDALALAASATGGAVDVRTAGGALTVGSASGDGVTLVAGGAGSAITLNGAVNAGTGAVTLTAGTVANRGAIVAGIGGQITGGALTATGSAIGTGAARLNTAVGSLTATSSNGGIFITEADAVNLSANATGGAVDVETTNGALAVSQATGNTVTLTAGGAGSGITVNGAVNAGAGNVTLTAGTAANRGAIVAGAGNQVTGGSLTATGSAIGTGAARLNTTVASLDATSTSGGIFVTESDALNVTASASGGAVDVRTTNGALAVASAVGDGVTLAAGGAGNGITLNGAVNAGAGDVTLTAGTVASGGAIIAGAGHQITGNSLTASGSAIGTDAARLNTTVASLNATSTNGGIFVSETDALNLAASATGGAVDVQSGNGSLTVAAVSGNGVTLTAGGAGNGITLNGAVNAGAGDVTLTAGTAASRGAIVAGAGNQVIGGSLIATGSAIGTSAARLNTTVASLNATSTNGGIFVTESDALNVTASASGGAVDVRTTNGALTVASAVGEGVTLAAGGAGNGITLNGAVNAGAGNVTLTAGGAIIAGAGHQIAGNSLTASGSAIGTEAARLNTTVASLNATSTNGGIFIAETDALNLTASATGGAVDVQSGNGSLTVAAVSGDGVTLTAGGAGNGITLNGAVNAGAGDVTLTAGTAASRGTIVGAAGHSISGSTLTATAASIGSSAARLNTNIDALNAATTGDAYITEQNGLTLANVSARNLDVSSVSGDIGVSTVAATGNVTLTANSGAITDDGDDATRLSANALTLSARSIGAASTLSGGTLNSTARLDTSVETLNATASAGGIFIDEADGLQSVNVQASGGAAGDIELLTLAGDLRLQHVSASDTLLLAAGRNIFAAPSAAPVTARVAELRAGTSDPTGGQIGTLADSIEFQLSAGNSLRLFVPQTIDPDDPNRAPATLPSAGVTSTLNLFASQNILATLAGFNQFQGLGETQFSSPAETLVRTLQSQTGTVQTGLDIDWGSFDPEVSLFGTLEPSVCLPADQRDEESSTPDC